MHFGDRFAKSSAMVAVCSAFPASVQSSTGLVTYGILRNAVRSSMLGKRTFSASPGGGPALLVPKLGRIRIASLVKHELFNDVTFNFVNSVTKTLPVLLMRR